MICEFAQCLKAHSTQGRWKVKEQVPRPPSQGIALQPGPASWDLAVLARDIVFQRVPHKMMLRCHVYQLQEVGSVDCWLPGSPNRYLMVAAAVLRGRSRGLLCARCCTNKKVVLVQSVCLKTLGLVNEVLLQSKWLGERAGWRRKRQCSFLSRLQRVCSNLLLDVRNTLGLRVSSVPGPEPWSFGFWLGLCSLSLFSSRIGYLTSQKL